MSTLFSAPFEGSCEKYHATNKRMRMSFLSFPHCCNKSKNLDLVVDRWRRYQKITWAAPINGGVDFTKTDGRTDGHGQNRNENKTKIKV
jgi:hypothetical protein